MPVIVEVYTDTLQRTAPETRVLLRKGRLDSSGANKFMFDQVGLVEAHRPTGPNIDVEEAAIEAGASDVQPMTGEQNDDIPARTSPAPSSSANAPTSRPSLNGSSPTVGPLSPAIGYLPKTVADLTEEQAAEVGEFLQALDEHDDMHRVWAAVK